MEIWQAIVLGAVQGFAEFLPISSSGHLILLQHWFGIQENVIFYSVMLHVGTLIPVVVVLWKEILGLFKKPFNKFWYLVLATIPAGVVGIIFSKVFDLDSVFANNVWLLAITFTFTATEMMFSEWRAKKKELLSPLTAKNALYMGLGQAIGVLPGVSRSGSTITAGTIAGVNKEDNANFTFLMSIPIILAALVLEGYDCIKEGTIANIDFLPVILGMITAMVCGYIAITFMLKLIKKANYKWFSLYLVLLSISVIITSAVGI
ncbi:MAG: undecaprenyl-diphosphate phosphatase [Clostridiales bacterium]|nr:undecaprenyl-diphosphate phosphatase [Clostridiales bacterium]